MGGLSRLTGRALGLPAPLTTRVRANRRIGVRMRDGVRLRTDHYAPDLPTAPTVLVRTPYGLGARPALLARTIAEQGFHVVLQSCRGTFESGGEFEPMRHERADGLDTLDWLRAQPWYSGELCTFGPSYVGFVQWAIAAEAGPELKAMATAVTASDFRHPTYAGGAFSLDTVLTWAALMHAQRGSRWANFVELRRGQPRGGRCRWRRAACSRGPSPTGRIQRCSPVFRSMAVIRPYGGLTRGSPCGPPSPKFTTPT